MKISQSICIENQVTGSNVIGASIGNGRSLNPSRPNPRRREKYKLNFYFHTSLWCLNRCYEGLKDLHKTCCGTTKKCENKNLT